jgi:flagellar biogenesis protein FliO
LGALVAVLALVWMAQRIIKATVPFAMRPRGEASRMVFVQALPLDQRRRLHLIRCDDRHVLLLTGGGSDVVVGWLEDGKP